MSVSAGTRVERPRIVREPQPRRAIELVPWAPLLAGVLVLAWWIVAPRTPDLAAQIYRVWLFEHAGFVLWDNSWYAGHHVPGYSLLFPPFASLVGTRALGGIAVIASAWMFEALARRLYGRGTLGAALWFAVAAAGDAWIGRLTFALGVTFAVGACLAFVQGVPLAGARRRVLVSVAAASATLAAASSPVAGLLLVLAAVSWALGGAWERWRSARLPKPVAEGPVRNGDGGEELAWGAPGVPDPRGMPARRLASLCGRRLRFVLPLLAGPAAVVVALQALFPEGGYEPYSAVSLAATLSVALAFIVALPPEQRLLRAAAWIYVVANLLSEMPTPMGSNLQRYGVLLAGPLLLCALMGEGPRRGAVPHLFLRRGGRPPEAAIPSGNGNGADRGQRSRLPRWALTVALAGMGLWVLWGPVAQTREVVGNRSTRTSYYAPVRSFFASLHTQQPLRVEVPFTRAHWEAALLAPYVSLARGWERQLDKRYNRPLEASDLTPAGYRAWLDEFGVSYVALPDTSFDESSGPEVRLIRGGLPYLREVFRDAHWRIFHVRDPAPLVVSLLAAASVAAAARAARMTSVGHQSFALQANAPGPYLVKIHFTPYWSVTAGAATLGQGPDGFTEVRVRRPGRVAVSASFTLGAAWSAFGMGL